MRRVTPRGRAGEWALSRSVTEVFETLRAETMARKRDHVMELPPVLSGEQAAVLEANLSRLPLGQATKIIAYRSAAILADLCRGQEGGGEASPWRAAWRGYEHVLGLAAGGCDPEEAAAQFRHCVIAQALAAAPSVWADPALALLYAGMWHALHAGLGESATRQEPMITEEILTQIKNSFRYRIVEPLARDGTCLPRPYRLDVAVASMQDGHDHLGADLALVVGTRVLGREMFRVVVFQAKKLNENGYVDIGSKDSGKQLRKLLSTGMGWYLFYPTPEKSSNFIVTARPANEVYADVWRGGKNPRYVGPFANGRASSSAWDLPTFVCVRMASDDLLLGRLFPDADSVAATLSTERTTPLRPRVLAVDLTGALNLGKFVADLKSSGYQSDGVLTVSGMSDPDVKFDHGHPAPSGGRRHRG